ncbi:MAG: DNA polymerase domain-containing protein [Syntrophomonadaceae bacterium]|nr:DNA polymerase domain-containing protein [Syntrophomonadaceae bacterium]
MNNQQVTVVAGRQITLTNLNKVLWPRDGLTKAELIRYYAEVYPYLAEHLRHRPLVVTRFPDGVEGKSFYQKNAPEHTPPWVATVPVYSEESRRTIDFVLANDLPTMCWLANQACIELHPWMSRCDKPDYPDFAVIDLDPSEGATYKDACEVALVLKHVLDQLGLVAYVKTSGATGLHIYIPVKRKHNYEAIRCFTRRIAEMTVELVPRKATVVRQVKKRAGRVYVDYLQNVRGKTVCAPYSVRPLPGAPVSTPLRWEEIPDSHPGNFTIRTVLARLQKHGDLFAPVLINGQSLLPAWQRLGLPSAF